MAKTERYGLRGPNVCEHDLSKDSCPWCQLQQTQEERDRWRGRADCSELDGFLGPSGEPECQGGDEIPSEPMCLTHRSQVAEAKAAEQRALAERLREAGVTDYSSLGCNRVDCHFCSSVWRPGELPRHRKNCPLAPAEAQEGEAHG